MKIQDILVSANIAACPGRFRQALAILLPLECAFEDDNATIRMENVPGDSGGRTFAGLDEATWGPLGFAYEAPNPAAVVKCYECEWNRLRCCELPSTVGIALFIQATNQGDKRCETMLQEAVNDFTLPSKQITVDGVIGPATIKAAWPINSDDLTRAFLAKSKARYKQILASGRFDQFADGWMNRINHVTDKLGLA